MEKWQQDFVDVINKIAKTPSDTKRAYLMFGVLDERLAK